jgi:NTE family protein
MTRTGTSPPAAPPRTRARPLLLVVLCAGAFLGAVDVQLVNVAFPALLRAFRGSSLADLSWVVNGYTITFTAALLPAGGLADRFGHRRIYLAGLAVFTAGAALCAAAPSPGVLVAARLVQGAGGGVITPLTLALLLPQYPAERRGVAIALWSAAQSVATASGPALGGTLVGVWSWRTVFVLHIPVGAAVLAGCWYVLPRADPAAGRLPDLAGLALLVAAIGLPSLAIVQSHAWGAWSAGTALTMAAGVAAAAVFVRRSLRHPAPIVDLTVLRLATTRRANLAMFVLGLVMFTWALVNVLFLTGVWHYSEARAGLALTPGPIAQAGTALLTGRLVRRLGYRTVALCGGALLTAAVLGLALLAHGNRSYATVLLPALLCGGAGITALVTSLSGACVAGIPAERLGTATALSVSSRAVGAVIGYSVAALVLTGAAVHAVARYHGLWLTMAVLCAVLAAITVGLDAGRSARKGIR